jgi:hypothetical protein
MGSRRIGIPAECGLRTQLIEGRERCLLIGCWLVGPCGYLPWTISVSGVDITEVGMNS